MAIRFPTAEDVTNSLKNHPSIFVGGIVLGMTVGLFLGWSFGSSGFVSATARAQLLVEQRDANQTALSSTQQKINEYVEATESLKVELTRDRDKFAKSIAAKDATTKELRTSLRRLEGQLNDARERLAGEIKKSGRLEQSLRSKLSAASSERKIKSDRISMLSNEISDLKQKNVSLNARLAALTAPKPKPEAAGERILVYLFKSSGTPTQQNIAESLRLVQGVADYHIDLLRQLGYVTTSRSSPGRGIFGSSSFWEITQKGRQYVYENKLGE